MKLSTFLLSLVLFCSCHNAMLGQNSFIAGYHYFESTDTILYQPVCGIDGKSYINAEEAEAAGLSEWTLGDCCSYEKIIVEDAEMAWIEQIIINDVELELTEWAVGHQDQTHQFFDLYRSQVNFISLGGESTNETCGMKWTIWIDFNENRLFEASELVYEGTQSREDIQLKLTTQVEGELVTRMRVRWTAENEGQKSGKMAIGEVADYTVFFQ